MVPEASDYLPCPQPKLVQHKYKSTSHSQRSQLREKPEESAREERTHMEMTMKKLKKLVWGEKMPREGRIRVSVGRCSTPKKFELEANFLNHPILGDLLRSSGDEFGYSYGGAVRIPCEVDLFLHLLHLLESRDPSVCYMGFREICDSFPIKYQ